MFDDLPPSDDENVDVLIDLQSPEQKKASDVEPVEEVEKKDSDKKAEATLLLLNLEGLLKENKNADTHSILHDLQKLLGIDGCNNSEILHACLPNTGNNLQNKKKSECNEESKKSFNSESDLTNDQLENSDCKINSPDSNKVQNNKHVEGFENCKLSNNEAEQTKSLKLTKINNKNKLDAPVEYEKLVDVLHTLNKIVNENDSQLLKNLSSVLKLAADEKEQETSKTLITKKRELTPKLNRSTPLRPPNRSSSLMDTPRLPEKRKSLMLNMKKRFHSNPELNNSASPKPDDISTKTKNSRPPITRST